MTKIRMYLQPLMVLALLFTARVQGNSSSNSDDIVVRHLDAIGSQSVRAAVKARVVRGSLRFRVLVGGSGGVTCTWDLVSSGRMLDVVMQFGMGDWWGEQ